MVNAKEVYGVEKEVVAEYYTARKTESGRIVGGLFGTDSEMFTMQILSDVQELIARNQNEEARQLINRTKHFLSSVMDLRRGV